MNHPHLTRGASPQRPEPLLVDEREAARLLSCSTRTLYNLRKRGELPAIKIGEAVRYDVEDLREFIERAKRGPRADRTDRR